MDTSRSNYPGPEPDEGGESFVEQLRRAISRFRIRLGGGQGQQALPLSEYRGQPGPAVPYHERRQQLIRSRPRQHGSYALVFVAVLLVMVIGIFYGLTWALGGLSGGGQRATPTVVGPVVLPAASPSPSPPTAVLATPGPGGTLPSPSPAFGATPLVGPGTPEPRSYIVKPGDTPNGIAREFNISTDALMRANNIADARSLRAGERLVIPPPSTPTPAPTPTTPR